MRASVAALVQRHEALRTQILVTAEGSCRQQITDCDRYGLETVDLSAVPEYRRQIDARSVVEQLIEEPLDLTHEPLFVAMLLKLADCDHVFVLAAHHQISDAYSTRILWRDIWKLYAQRVSGTQFSFPEIPIQLADYAVWQQKSAANWSRAHGRFWNQRLAGARRVSLFGDAGVAARLRSSPLRFGNDLTAALREFSWQERSTLSMVVLTMFAATVMRWVGASDLVVPLRIHGRSRSEVIDTVGFFSSVLLVRVSLVPGESFLDLLGRFISECAEAIEHDDQGRLFVQASPSPECIFNPYLNWASNELTDHSGLQPDWPFTDDLLRQEPFDVSLTARAGAHLEFDFEPRLSLTDRGTEIVGRIVHKATPAALANVDSFVQSLSRLAQELVGDPSVRLAPLDCAGRSGSG